MRFSGSIILLRACVGLAASLLVGCNSSSTVVYDGKTSAAASAPHQDSELARKLVAQGREYIEQCKWSEAKAALLKAIDADVTLGSAHNDLGTIYLHENDLYQAAWEFQYASRLMPYQPEPRSNLGLVLEQAGKLDEAIDWYDQAIQLEPDNPQFVGNSARARVRRGDKDSKIRELLEKVASNDSRSDWVLWAKEKLVLMGPLPTTTPEE